MSGRTKAALRASASHAAAEEPDDVFDPHQADDARKERGHHEHDGGGKDAVRVGGVKQAAEARPTRRRRRGWGSTSAVSSNCWGSRSEGGLVTAVDFRAFGIRFDF